MKVKSVVIATLLAGCAIGAALGLGNVGSWATTSQTEPTTEAPDTDPFLEPGNPPAKAVVDERVHDFDVMERGASGEHVFSLRNEGEGVLRIKKGKATCTCTKFVLGDDAEETKFELQPGESIDVTVAWKIKDSTEETNFKTLAPVHTNDPDNKYIPFGIIGKVAFTMFVSPARTFLATDVVGDKPVTVSGIVGSRLLDDLELVSVETDSKFLQIEHTKLEFTDGTAEGVPGKCGYRFDVTVDPGIPIGKFDEPFRVKFRAPNGKEYEEELRVATTRSGPMKIVGKDFDVRTMTLNMRDFDVAKGKTTKLTLPVTDPYESESYEFNVAKATKDNVQLHIERDEKFKGNDLQKYSVIFEIPPGTAETRENEGRAEFVVDTNHPDIKSIRFRARYQAY